MTGFECGGRMRWSEDYHLFFSVHIASRLAKGIRVAPHYNDRVGAY